MFDLYLPPLLSLPRFESGQNPIFFLLSDSIFTGGDLGLRRRGGGHVAVGGGGERISELRKGIMHAAG